MKNHSSLTLRTMFRFTLAVGAIAVLLLTAWHSAHAQDRNNGNFLDNLFSRGEGPRQGSPGQGGQVVQGQGIDPSDPSELTVRIDRLESALRQLTGTIEQLQYRNQQLEQQVRALQGGGAPAQSPVAPQGVAPQVRPGVPGALQPSTPGQPGRRSDVFDPAQSPDAPGAPRALGTANASSPIVNDSPVGAPNGRAAGEPLDLSTLSGNSAQAAAPMQTGAPGVAPRDVTNQRLATLPPSATPQDEYDLAYGYVLRKDYALAEQTFRDFLRKYPNDAQVADANYWLGESLFQRQKYRDAAESFLAVSTKHEKAARAPNALLRLGQSLAALDQKEAACATLAEVNRKYPKAGASVKRGVEQEIKRAKC